MKKMANMYDTANCSSSSSPAEADDFSLFLGQIMLRSSSSSSSLVVHKGNEMHSFVPTCTFPENQNFGIKSSVFSGPDRISMPESSSGLNLPTTYAGFASPRACFHEGAVNVSSSSVSVGTADNDLNEYDCESEEGFEGVVEEATAKPTLRNPSKRSRAAEVHNLSEKRRRSRINEKMKALQNLIPNSNKTDKASMLDEAIEYLKQLQLQVQLLTMRNGVNLYPMCSTGVLQSNDISQLRMGYSEGNRPLNVNMAQALPLHEDTPANFLFTLPHLYTNPKQTSVANITNVNESENSFCMESSPQVHLGSFELPPDASSKGICMEKLPCQLVKESLSRSSAVGYVAAEARSSIPFNEQASDLEENTLEACIRGRDQSRALLLTNLECEAIHLPEVECIVRGRSPLDDNGLKAERPKRNK